MEGFAPRGTRSSPRRRTVGVAPATLRALDGRFPPARVDVLDVSTGGVCILAPSDVPLAVGDQVALLLPVKPFGQKLFAVEVRWLKANDLFVSAGMVFI